MNGYILYTSVILWYTLTGTLVTVYGGWLQTTVNFYTLVLFSCLHLQAHLLNYMVVDYKQLLIITH